MLELIENYEIHITANVTDIDTFIIDCQNIGVKPIIIETENDDGFEKQIMTSSKHRGYDYMVTLNDIAIKLGTKYKILRQKVEIQPLNEKHPEHIYYESHLRLKLDKNFDLTAVKNSCKLNGFHFSKNLFKRDENFNYQMITYRGYNMSFEYFSDVIDKMSNELRVLNINCDKIEIEECVYDTNTDIDKNWLKI